MGQLEKPYTRVSNYARIKWNCFRIKNPYIKRRLFHERTIILSRRYVTRV